MKPDVPGVALVEIGNRHSSSPTATGEGEGIADDFACDAAGEAKATGFVEAQERAITAVAATRTTDRTTCATARYCQTLLSGCGSYWNPTDAGIRAS
jgi:hypothetical protein